MLPLGGIIQGPRCGLRFWGVCGSSFLYKCTQAVLKDCCFSLQLFGNVFLEVTYLESDFSLGREFRKAPQRDLKKANRVILAISRIAFCDI